MQHAFRENKFFTVMRQLLPPAAKKEKVSASRKLGVANFHSSATLCAMRMIDSKEKGYEYCDDLKGFKSRRKRRDYKG